MSRNRVVRRDYRTNQQPGEERQRSCRELWPLEASENSELEEGYKVKRVSQLGEIIRKRRGAGTSELAGAAFKEEMSPEGTASGGGARLK